MNRRTFIGACGGSLLIARSEAEAQSAAKTYRVGFLSYATPAQSALLLREFTEGLRELGYIDGRNIVIELHFGDGTFNRLSELADGVVRSRVDVIVTGSNPIATAAKRATTTIPIIMVGTLDPVGIGLVASLSRPGGNVTGLCVDASAEMSSKMLGLLAEIVPALSRVGVLRQFGYADPLLEAAARKLDVELHAVDVRTFDELESAFAEMRRKRVGAMIVRGSLFYVRRQQVAELALKHHLPAIHALKEYAQAGLLMTYGANLADLYRRAAAYVDRIAKGARPSDLPVEQPTKFDLVINLNTAKVLGLTIPQSLLLRADEVIR
jgi:putative tryptophan/tyrosine transport system substrate-binding protein